MTQLLEKTVYGIENYGQIYSSVVLIFIALVLGIVLYAVVVFLLKRIYALKVTTGRGDLTYLEYFKKPLKVLIPPFGMIIIAPLLQLPEKSYDLVRHILSIWIIIAISWLLVKIIHVGRDIILSHYHVDIKNNLEARRMSTQIRVIERILTVLIIFIGAAAVLMTFDRVRQVGISLLASAGVMGIVLGLAAQRTLGSIIAGIQIAIAQPIRLDDVVVVENEWGWIEEITLTFVVIRIWDLRRLVVPISYFMEKPFQNWTRTSADLLGSVYLYADYTIPLAAIRGEFQKILDGSKLWDKKVGVLQVTDATKDVIEIRALMSAVDSPTVWDLRCLVREKLIAFMQDKYPQSLPRLRVEMENQIAF